MYHFKNPSAALRMRTKVTDQVITWTIAAQFLWYTDKSKKKTTNREQEKGRKGRA